MRTIHMAWGNMQFRNADCGLLSRHLECRRGELYCLQSEVALPTVAANFVWHRIPWQEETRTGEAT